MLKARHFTGILGPVNSHLSQLRQGNRLKPIRSSTARHPAGRRDGSQRAQLCIIGGQWRGRKLPFVSADGLRPTGDRIRETLFNWLQPELPGARCLDLFSGSGALGLEALSRGAASASLLELNAAAADCIRDNVHLLQCRQAEVITTDCLSWLQQARREPYQIVFIDPPFQLQLWQPVVEALERGQWLASEAAIYIETPRGLALSVPRDWRLHRQKQAGDVCYRLFFKDGEDSHPGDCPSAAG